jgi:hypothetical protein
MALLVQLGQLVLLALLALLDRQPISWGCGVRKRSPI